VGGDIGGATCGRARGRHVLSEDEGAGARGIGLAFDGLAAARPGAGGDDPGAGHRLAGAAPDDLHLDGPLDGGRAAGSLEADLLSAELAIEQDGGRVVAAEVEVGFRAEKLASHQTNRRGTWTLDPEAIGPLAEEAGVANVELAAVAAAGVEGAVVAEGEGCAAEVHDGVAADSLAAGAGHVENAAVVGDQPTIGHEVVATATLVLGDYLADGLYGGVVDFEPAAPRDLDPQVAAHDSVEQERLAEFGVLGVADAQSPLDDQAHVGRGLAFFLLIGEYLGVGDLGGEALEGVVRAVDGEDLAFELPAFPLDASAHGHEEAHERRRREGNHDEIEPFHHRPVLAFGPRR